MMDDGAWFDMGWIWFYWSLPVLITVIVILAWQCVRKRPKNSR